jgi:hypothetical protein
MRTPPFADPAVRSAFDAFPNRARDGLMRLRQMIHDIAAETDGVGALEETLKWGQPAYLTPETKSGSTIRLAAPKTGGYAICTHCQTTIISDFQALFPGQFAYDGNRAVLFGEGGTPPDGPIRMLIRNALTYHLKK